MNDHTTTAIVSVLIAIIGVATVAVLVSSGAQTTGVLGAAGNAFAGILRTAVTPVTSAGGLGGILGQTSGNTPIG